MAWLCRYDFTQVLAELEIDGGKLGLKVLADEAFRSGTTNAKVLGRLCSIHAGSLHVQ